MMIYTVKFDKKKAAFWAIMAALVIIGIVLLLGAGGRGGAQQTGDSPGTSVKTEKARVAYLESCGWKVEPPAMKEETVLIPKEFSKVFETYNSLQKKQGFDLSRCAGQEVTLYTYRVLDSGLGDEILASLYVKNGTVVGGDVHSTALDGFMCGLRQEK